VSALAQILTRDTGAAGLPAHQIEAAVHDDAVDPGGKRRTPLETPDVLPGLEKAILNRVLGVVRVVQHFHRDPECARPRFRQQSFESGAVPLTSRFDPRVADVAVRRVRIAVGRVG
jgi:hypothetical protein